MFYFPIGCPKDSRQSTSFLYGQEGRFLWPQWGPESHSYKESNEYFLSSPFLWSHSYNIFFNQWFRKELIICPKPPSSLPSTSLSPIICPKPPSSLPSTSLSLSFVYEKSPKWLEPSFCLARSPIDLAFNTKNVPPRPHLHNGNNFAWNRCLELTKNAPESAIHRWPATGRR